MKLYSYTLTYDTGFVPNPFWGYCTVAHCTLNHMKTKLSPEDWIMGTSNVNYGYKLIYAMQVSEKIYFHDYFTDDRFQNKKPKLNGSWKEQCGDNIYFFSSNREWKQIPSIYHTSSSEIKKDTKNSFVYVAERFWYFGENTIEIPTEFQALIRKGRGYRNDNPIETIKGFTNWIKANFKIGIHGMPRDRETFISCGKKEKSSRTKRCT